MSDIDTSHQLNSLGCCMSDSDQLGPDLEVGELTEKNITLTLRDSESGLYYSYISHTELALKQGWWNKPNNQKENSNSLLL